MSSYYHAFQIGWNNWYLFVLFAAFTAFFAGYKNIHLKRKNGRIKFCRHLNFNLYRFIAAGAALITALMVASESGRGIIQFFDNGLTQYESPIYSVIFAPFVVGAIALAELTVCLIAANLGEKAKKNRIRKYHHQFEQLKLNA